MSSVTIARTLALAAVIAAVGIVYLMRGREGGDAPSIEPSAAPPNSSEAAAPRPAAAPSAAAETPAAARLRELEQMSETFRNTTFLIAIRDAGFVCNELRGVYGGVNDSTTWTASCSEMLAYTVRVASNGGLGIEPALQHVDSVAPAPVRDFGGERVLPPQLPRALPPPR
jgi:hypothetical protein